MDELCYLASPYSKYPGGRKKAFEEVCKKAAQLMLEGKNIFCPIAHSHPIELEGMDNQMDGDFWLNQDFAVLLRCDKLLVYKMPGWDESYGINKEMLQANWHGIPIEFIEYVNSQN